tara:strand:+ start:6934 stop:7317 length:384 start_codon:yes stop_codon:yes gene_type:complete
LKRAAYNRRYQKIRYAKVKESQKHLVKQRKLEIKDWYHNLKESLRCADCDVHGNPHSWILEFHHLHPSDKFAGVSNMVHDGYSKKRILEEIEKCQVLCANCHRIRHKEHYSKQEDILRRKTMKFQNP